MSIMLEIVSRSWTEKELTNRIGQLIELFKYDWLILSLSEISERFLASWIQNFSCNIFYKNRR